MARWTQDAPAKVNLALDILRRRPDGYHDLYMVMHTLSLCDTVTVEEQPDGFTFTADTFTPPPGRSMEQRAAEAFFSAVGEPMPGLRVTLQKRIPTYAGLGGGSADVAALLRILRDAYCPSLCADALAQIGLSIGSDVPFCLRGGAALAEGRGERLTALPPLPDAYFVLCKPPFGIPTPTLFARADETPWTRRPDVDAMADAMRRQDVHAVAACMGNVFEEVLPPEYAEVFDIKRQLIAHGAENAVMSGSGPTVCGMFRDAADAHRAAETLKQTYPETFEASPLT